MHETILELKEKFEKIKEKGYIRGIYNSLSSSGRTFEEELGLPRNKESVPDYNGIEIKTRRTYSKSAITLFTMVPDGERSIELNRIRETYGYPCKKDRNYKVLYAEVYGNRLNFAGLKYQYKIDVDRKKERLYLGIYDKKGKKLERKVYWSFDSLKDRLTTKLNILAIINIWPKQVDGWNYFKYYNINFYILKSFDKFIDMLESGDIKLTIKLGIYLDQEHYGKMYDHGCSFGVYEKDITKLFYKYIIDDNKYA